MPQYNIPQSKNVKYPELMNTKELNIHTGTGGNPGGDIQGLYRPGSGEIFLSTYEKTTPRVLWHEQMHKILMESLNLEKGSEENPVKSTIQWDNIANELEEFLFPKEKMPHYAANFEQALKTKKGKQLEDLLKSSFR